MDEGTQSWIAHRKLIHFLKISLESWRSLKYFNEIRVATAISTWPLRSLCPSISFFLVNRGSEIDFFAVSKGIRILEL
jgi:hypothetical protein